MADEIRIVGGALLGDARMKKVQAGEHALLLVRWRGQLRVMSLECPHFGAELHEGTLVDGHIRCPWHQSVFDALTGDLLEPPALDGLQCLSARVEGEDILVGLPDAPIGQRTMPMAAPDHADLRVFVILGTGAAGLAAAEALRECGYTGRVMMVTREPHRPYDRTELSKQYLAKPGAPQPFVRTSEFYATHGIEVLTGREVRSVDVAARVIACHDGLQIRYDKLLLATGARPRRLDVPGQELSGVMLLRSLEDSTRLRESVRPGGRAVVIGSSFIGMEVAASINGRGVLVTVVGLEHEPFEKSMGPQIGAMYRRVHEEAGNLFRMGRRVDRFEGRDGRLRAVVLDDGERIDADIAVVGVGVEPVSDYLHGLPINSDGSLNVDEHLQAAPDVYVAGDLACYVDWRTNQRVRIEHWRLAEQLGRVGAANMAGRPTQYRAVPFFWTNQLKLNVRYVGFAKRWDRIEFDGSTEGRDFVAWYISEGKVHAAAGCKRDRAMDLVAEVMRREGLVDLARMREAVGQLMANQAPA